MDNYMMYMGSDGVYTHTVPYERDPQCLMSGSGVPLQASDSMTLEQVRPHDRVAQYGNSQILGCRDRCTY